MKKFLLFIFTTAFFTTGFFLYKSEAASLNDLKNQHIGLVVTKYNNTYNVYFSNSWDINWEIGNNVLYTSSWANYSGYWDINWDPISEPDRDLEVSFNTVSNINLTDRTVVIIYNTYTTWGYNNVDILTENEYIESITPDPSFWELTWQGFWDTLSVIGDGIEQADEALWDWIKSLFTDENTTPDYNSILVTPAPTPTPIEVIYRQVTTPDSNGGSTTTNQYVYKDSNNNTIVATAIPTNGIVINLPSGNTNSGGNGSGDGSSDPSKYSPANPLEIPDYPWLNPHAFAENQDQFPLDTLQNAEDFTKEAAENYLTGVTGIFSLLSFIPQELYVIVGIGISIIVIAGIMCKLLGG